MELRRIPLCALARLMRCKKVRCERKWVSSWGSICGLELSLVQLRSLSHTPGGTSIENRRSTYTRHLADLPFVTWHIKYQSLIDKRWLLWQEVVRHPTRLMAVSCPWRTLGTQSRTQRPVKLTAGSSVHSLAVLRKRCVLPFVSLCRLHYERGVGRGGGGGRWRGGWKGGGIRWRRDGVSAERGEPVYGTELGEGQFGTIDLF